MSLSAIFANFTLVLVTENEEASILIILLWYGRYSNYFLLLGPAFILLQMHAIVPYLQTDACDKKNEDGVDVCGQMFISQLRWYGTM